MRVLALAACTLLVPIAVAAQAGRDPVRSCLEVATQATMFVLDLGSAGAARSVGSRGVTFRAGFRPASREGGLAIEASYAELPRNPTTHPVPSPRVTLASVAATRWMRPQDGRRWSPTRLATFGAGILRLATSPSATCRVGTGCIDVESFEHAEATSPVLVLASAGRCRYRRASACAPTCAGMSCSATRRRTPSPCARGPRSRWAWRGDSSAPAVRWR